MPDAIERSASPLWVRTCAGLSPIGVLFILYAGLMAALRNGIRPLIVACAVIGGSLVLLVGAGAWLVRVNRLPGRVRLTMWTTAGVACLGWAWQRVAYLVFIPNDFLSYGYFQSEAGSIARVYMMEAPLKVGAALFLLCVTAAILTAWGADARWSLVALLLWWLVAYLIFATGSLNLWAQGDAAIFI